jgi:anti-sigma B factor antagonist
MLTITTETHGAVTRLQLIGELDMFTRGQFLHAVDEALTAPGLRQLTIDLAHLSFCDSTGVQALLEGQAKAAKTHTDSPVEHAHGSVARVFKVCGVWETLAGPQTG